MTKERPHRRRRADAQNRMSDSTTQTSLGRLAKEIGEIKHRLQALEVKLEPSDIPNLLGATTKNRANKGATFRLPRAMHEKTFSLMEEIRSYLEQDDLQPSHLIGDLWSQLDENGRLAVFGCAVCLAKFLRDRVCFRAGALCREPILEVYLDAFSGITDGAISTILPDDKARSGR